MKAYKLFRILKDGSISSLFINKTARLKIDTWLKAEAYPTKGFSFRPHWHCTGKPEAPHLSLKGRAWYEVRIQDFEKMTRSEIQGGIWYLANKIKILRKVK
tara:strand:+ start:463 stop:765 length:303 start_codon:yes stop_codon:yes gene_type:complete